MFNLSTLRRPWIASFHTAVRTVLPFHSTSRGRPTFTESSCAIWILTVRGSPGADRQLSWSDSPIFAMSGKENACDKKSDVRRNVPFGEPFLGFGPAIETSESDFPVWPASPSCLLVFTGSGGHLGLETVLRFRVRVVSPQVRFGRSRGPIRRGNLARAVTSTPRITSQTKRTLRSIVLITSSNRPASTCLARLSV